MKKIFKIVSFCFLVTLVSCDLNEGKIYKGDHNEFTLLSFDSSVYSLDIVINAEGTLEIPFRASATAPFDRTYPLELIEDENNPADPLTYNMPTSVTIPANQYVGMIVITGEHLGLVDATAKLFHFRVADLNDKEFMDEDTVTVGVVQVCPLMADFTGAYAIEFLEGDDFWQFMDNGDIVNVVQTSEFGRAFHIPVFLVANVSATFGFNMNCEQVNATGFDTTVWCGSGNSYSMGTGATPGSYTVGDDSEIIITYTDNINEACGRGPVQGKIRLTKQ